MFGGGPQTNCRSIPLMRPYNKQAAMFSHSPTNGHHGFRTLNPGRRSWSRAVTPIKPPHHLPPGASMPTYVPYKSVHAPMRSHSTPPLLTASSTKFATQTFPVLKRVPSTLEVTLASRRSWTGDELEVIIRDKIQEKTKSGNGQTLMALRLFGAGASANEQEITPSMFQDTLSRMLNTEVNHEEAMRLFVKYIFPIFPHASHFTP